jgi:DNA-binding NarL/FixJ family response regulator
MPIIINDPELPVKANHANVIRIAIVDDDPTALENFTKLFSKWPEFLCVGTFLYGELLFQAIPEINPHVVLMDINLPTLDGIQCVRLLKAQHPDIQVIMLTIFEDSDRIFRALSVGASGYVLKRSSPAELLQAVRFVHSGGAAMTSLVARRVAEEFRRLSSSGEPVNDLEQLSLREKEVLEKLAEGCLVKEIADQLQVGFGTVRTYIRRIYEKLHVRSRAQATAQYYQHSGIHPTEKRRGA